MITIWHNPRCSKSRQTLVLLQESGTGLEVRRYLEDVPSVAELRLAQVALGNLSAFEMMRPGETLFRDLGFGTATPEDMLIAAMAKNPILIERPMVFRAGRAIIARPPELVRTLL